jgi:hypothetical protein
MQVEDMPTAQLLRRIIHPSRFPLRRWVPRNHILSTDNTASSAQAINLRLRRVRIACVHVPRSAAVFDEVEAFRGECAEGQVEWDDVVDREDSGKDEDGVEECRINYEFDSVCGKA